ncbi:60 kda ss-a/ro ribonucleoprotein-like [Plakobranchus ocellatus]|uniref:60 kDa ss-a/ro ribonucleoprotein-like n=1 Tax=Plakobranchus ocellatus TaxID=259542 RepID=A0AAV4AUK3_9GAST|nr:60 kda ss-a/ro ribonucleoprotein-like [Plakobranchus ocellatus]
MDAAVSIAISKTKAQEAALKKKLQVFLSDLQHMGTVAGFRHFTSYVRGREEIVLTVNNTLQGSLAGEFSAPASRRQSVCPSDSLTSSHLPYDKGSLVLSHNTQLSLSGRRERGIGLPPASPSEEENGKDNTTTLFLVAGYARYSCPYVWVRSNHERLFKLSGEEDSDRDSPLRLKSTARWKDGDVHASDIVAELVRLCTYPSPRNPFEVDLEYFQSLPQPEQLLASAAMIALLQKIVIHTPDSKAYAGKVSEDLRHISRLHFHSLQELTQTQSLPVLKQPQKQQQQQQKHRPQGLGQRNQQQHRHLQQQPHSPQSSSTHTAHRQQPQQYKYHQPVAQQPTPSATSQQQQPYKFPQQPPTQTGQQQQQRYRYPQPTQQQGMQLPPPQGQPQQQARSMPPSSVAQAGLRPSASGAGYSHNPMGSAQATPPTNPNAARVYGRGPRGAFPGGFDRMPAPTLF